MFGSLRLVLRPVPLVESAGDPVEVNGVAKPLPVVGDSPVLAPVSDETLLVGALGTAPREPRSTPVRSTIPDGDHARSSIARMRSARVARTTPLGVLETVAAGAATSVGP